MSRIAELADAIGRHVRANGVHPTPLAPLDLFRGTEPTDWGLALYEPALVVLAQGSKEVQVGGVTHRYDPSQYVLASVDLPLLCRVVQASAADPYMGLRLRLDPVIVGEVLAECPAPPSETAARGLVVTPVEPALLDALLRLLALLETPGDVAYLLALLQREITYRVANGPQGARIRQIAASGAPAQRVAQAIAWIKEHAAEAIRVEEVAQQVGLGQSAFHLHFKTVTGMTPIQYQKRLRLMEARRLMVAAGLTAAESAYRVGYASPSQFSRDYRRLFGAPPKQDVATILSEDEVNTP